MAQNHNVYAIIGTNGYGMFSNWPDLVSSAKLLKSEWHRGFHTEEEAYEWLQDQAATRHRISACGLCDLPTLQSQHLVIIDDYQHPEQTANFRKPADVKEVYSINELVQCLDETNNRKEHNMKECDKKKRKKSLMKEIERLLDEYMDID